jgi:NAD-dependent deacetylase
MIEYAQRICKEADIFIVIGTSLQVYPAAGLIDFVSAESEKYLIDKNQPETRIRNVELIIKSSTIGVVELVDKLLI